MIGLCSLASSSAELVVRIKVQALPVKDFGLPASWPSEKALKKLSGGPCKFLSD